MGMLLDTCMPLIWPVFFPAGHPQLWSNTTDSHHLTSFSSSAEPCGFRKQGIALEIENDQHWVDTFLPLTSLLRDFLQFHLHHRREARIQIYSQLLQGKSMIFSCLNVLGGSLWLLASLTLVLLLVVLLFSEWPFYVAK